MQLRRYILECTVFIVGAVIMIFELVGSRVLGPYFGTSIFVWTSLIGIILGSLSLGYFLGGKLADTKPSVAKLASIIFLSGVCIGLTIFIKKSLLMYLQIHIPEIRVATIIASVLLFFPTSVLLGMVSPYAVKLKLENLRSAGATVGRLYAISTLGSIVGTFLAGFFLIPLFGTNILLMTLSIALMLLSVVLYAKPLKSIEIATMLLFIVGWGATASLKAVSNTNEFVDIDTAYNRIWIYNLTHPHNHKTIKIMGINNENHSSMYIDSDELVNEYAKRFHLARHFHPNFRTAVIFGGAGYSFPRDFLSVYPHATLDVVEIDPKVTKLAKQYFRLEDDPRMTIYHADGRVFLNTVRKQYDVIFGDAFGSRYSIPYQLTTAEAAQKKYDILHDNGIVVLNMISAIDGKRGAFLRAEYATYASIFPQVYVFPVYRPTDGSEVQNIVLVALKSKEPPLLHSTDTVLNTYLQEVWKSEIARDMPILTDDFAPVDFYANKTI